MKKKAAIIICVILSAFLITAVIFSFRFIGAERKNDEENYILAAKNIAYELGEYIETGDENFYFRAAADTVQMNSLTDTAKNIVSDENSEIMNGLSAVMEYSPQRIINEAEKLKAAFEMIAENSSNTDYAYTQIRLIIAKYGQ